MGEKTVGIETEIINMAVKIEGEYSKSKDLGWIKCGDSNIIKITYDMNQRDNMYTIELKSGPFAISNDKNWSLVKEGINSFIEYIIVHRQVECGKDIVIDKKGEYKIFIDKRIEKDKKAGEDEKKLEFFFTGTTLQEAKLGNQFTVGYSLDDVMKREHELKDINKWFRMIPGFKEADKEEFVCSMIVSICCYSALSKIYFYGKNINTEKKKEYSTIFSYPCENVEMKNCWGVLPRFTFKNIMQGLSSENIQKKFNQFFANDDLVCEFLESYSNCIEFNLIILNSCIKKEELLTDLKEVVKLYKEKSQPWLEIDNIEEMQMIKGGNLNAQKTGEFLFEYRVNTSSLRIYDPEKKKDFSFF